MEINPEVFREYDVRGIAERDLTDDFAFRLGIAYCRLLKSRLKKEKPKISIGRDCRLTSDRLFKALSKGILSQGVDVIDLGVCPTPVTYFSVFHLETDGGIMITGSHNPAEYNGFKIGIGKSTLHGQDIQNLRTLMQNSNDANETTGSKGNLSSYAILPAYQEYLVKQFSGLPAKKIVIDAGNGTAGNVAPPFFRALGAEVTELYCELDGRFPNHHPDPTVPENLKELRKTVLEKKADLGVAFDGDSDRIGLVDERGEVTFGDQIMIILSRQVLKETPGATIISEVKSSKRLYDDIAAHGGNPVMWKTGHSLIKSKMKELKAALAGEMSGHIFFADRYFGYDDAIYAAARLYEICGQSNEPISAQLKDIPPMVATPEIRVDCEDSKKFAIVEKSKALLSKDHKINDIDGIRIDFTDGWGLLRASNTQPVLVMRFEAQDQTRLDQIRSIFEDAVNQAKREVF